MTWKEMQDEIITDIAKIVAADNSARYIVGMVQWQGQIIGRAVYWPSPFELVGDRGATHGMSMMPAPPSDWKAVELKFVPKSPDGVPSKADTPLAYYVMGGKGEGVAFPARFHNDKGQITWTHNPEIIEHVGDMMLVAGLLGLAKENR